jgi:hypothetical protein
MILHHHQLTKHCPCSIINLPVAKQWPYSILNLLSNDLRASQTYQAMTSMHPQLTKQWSYIIINLPSTHLTASLTYQPISLQHHQFSWQWPYRILKLSRKDLTALSTYKAMTLEQWPHIFIYLPRNHLKHFRVQCFMNLPSNDLRASYVGISSSSLFQWG